MSCNHQHIEVPQVSTPIYKALRQNLRLPTGTAKRILKLYRKELGPMYRSVVWWQRLIRNAVLYGVEMQMMKRKKPLLEALTDYEEWKPEGPLEKRLVDLRVEQFAKRLGEVVIEKAPVTGVVAMLADWQCIRMEGDKRIGHHHLRIYGKAMGEGVQLAHISTTFDVVNMRAVEWASKHTNELVTGIVDETRAVLRNVISRGIENGDALGTRAQAIRQSIGLNERQEIALNTFREEQLAALTEEHGAAAAKEMIDDVVEKEYKRKLNYRSEMIARTETARAMTAGTVDGYAEAGMPTCIFDASADACPICAQYDGVVMELDRARHFIPVHPNCRCAMRPHFSPEYLERVGMTEEDLTDADLL